MTEQKDVMDIKNGSEESLNKLVDAAPIDENMLTITEDTPWFLKGPKIFNVPNIPFSDGDKSTDTDAPTRNRFQLRQGFSMATQGPDYWQIRKLIKFIKAGDESTTLVSLACLADYDLNKPENQYAIMDTGGIEILINILGVEHVKCLIGSLRILIVLVMNPGLGKMVIDLGALCELVILLRHSETDIILHTTKLMRLLTIHKKCRTITRKLDGIPILMDLVDIKPSILFGKRCDASAKNQVLMDIAINCIAILTELSKSPKVRAVLFQNGILRVLEGLLSAEEEELRLNGLKMIYKFASLSEFRKSFEINNTMYSVLKHWKDDEREELMSVSKIGRRQLVEFRAIKRLVNMLKSDATIQKPKTFKYAIGTLYRIAVHKGVRNKLNSLKLIPTLIRLLSYEKESVLVYITGLLAFMTSFPSNWKPVKDSGGLEPLMNMLQFKAEPKLMSNVARIIGDLAHNKAIMADLTKMEVLRFLWSLLNSKSPKVQEQAARALVPVIKHTPDAGEEIRNLSGALDIMMGLLDSQDLGVVAGGCEALAQVARDHENLIIITQLGIVEKIRDLVHVKSDILRESIGVVISGLARDPSNCFELGRLGCIAPLVEYLSSSNIRVVISAAYALWKLSYDPVNCISLHSAGVVPFLIECVKSPKKALRQAAAGCLFNLRNLAHDMEEIKCFGKLQKKGKNSKPTYKTREPKLIQRPVYPDDVEL